MSNRNLTLSFRISALVISLIFLSLAIIKLTVGLDFPRIKFASTAIAFVLALSEYFRFGEERYRLQWLWGILRFISFWGAILLFFIFLYVRFGLKKGFEDYLSPGAGDALDYTALVFTFFVIYLRLKGTNNSTKFEIGAWIIFGISTIGSFLWWYLRT